MNLCVPLCDLRASAFQFQLSAFSLTIARMRCGVELAAAAVPNDEWTRKGRTRWPNLIRPIVKFPRK